MYRKDQCFDIYSFYMENLYAGIKNQLILEWQDAVDLYNTFKRDKTLVVWSTFSQLRSALITSAQKNLNNIYKEEPNIDLYRYGRLYIHILDFSLSERIIELQNTRKSEDITITLFLNYLDNLSFSFGKRQLIPLYTAEPISKDIIVWDKEGFVAKISAEIISFEDRVD